MMKIDIHFHVAGSGRDIGNVDNDVYFVPEDNNHWLTRIVHNFRYLERPLEYGLTVIAAHCATPVFPLIDRNETNKFFNFMKKANKDGKVRLWADTSALSMTTRILLIPEIVHSFPPEWLVHGSDFPLPFDAWPHLPWVTHDMTPEEYIQKKKTKNPLDRDVRIKRGQGFPDSILSNAEKVLRILRT